MMDVIKGDNVFVAGSGHGQVTRVLPGGAGFQVRIGGIDRHFSMDGRIGGSGDQKVFYHDPMVVEPCRDGHLWQTYTRMSRLLFDEILRLAGLGLVADPEDQE
ncbi:MAG: hypothetical protein LBL95_00030 [Deltaproteobacteria bacterium]|jgi:hypothetical protein|nr:hypothetical protein [Deltaproteobacteria bacterium]